MQLGAAAAAFGAQAPRTLIESGWVSGVVGFGSSGPPNFDPARRV